MSDKNYNQQAFPIDSPIAGTYEMGMDLKDYFAAKAMQTIVSTQGSMEWSSFQRTANISYNMAEAMLKERAER